MNLRTLCLAIAFSPLAVGLSEAHHSHANYEPDEITELTGTVVDHQWVNPHTWIYVEVVNEDGESELWALESGSTGQLIQQGWTQESIAPGDVITAHVKRLRDGTNGGLLGLVELPDGTSVCNPGFLCPNEE